MSAKQYSIYAVVLLRCHALAMVTAAVPAATAKLDRQAARQAVDVHMGGYLKLDHREQAAALRGGNKRSSCHALRGVGQETAVRANKEAGGGA